LRHWFQWDVFEEARLSTHTGIN